VTDTLGVVAGGDDISPSVYDAIAARHVKEFPFFALPSKITGPLLQGEENARSSVVVFRTFDDHASRFTIYIGGLSGDIVRVKNPQTSSPPGDKKSGKSTTASALLLRRSLAIVYDLPGDPVTRQIAKPVRVSREWVMR
jgi:hypothetical protein